VRAEVLKAHQMRSVPAVFVKGKFVGGCNDGPEPWMGALPLLASGKLEEMIAAK
jgi:glutaredoxin-related protein